MTSESRRLPDVGRRLAAARLQRGLSQGTVSRLCGLAPSHLSRIETGKIQPTFRTVLRVAAAIRVPFEEIVGPEPLSEGDAGSCPISVSGRCLLDLIRSGGRVGRDVNVELYSPREIRLLQRFALWMRSATPERLRAMEVILDDLSRRAPPIGKEANGRPRKRRRDQ